MKHSEESIQAVLMQWALNNKHHETVITNSTVLFPWEADFVSVTRSGYIHEIEIKISVSDYKRDHFKTRKHSLIQFPNAYQPNSPNYFWYAATEGVEIDVPEYAGYLVIGQGKYNFNVCEKKPAPLLHKQKITAAQTATIARLLSFRLLSQSWKWLMDEEARQKEGAR